MLALTYRSSTTIPVEAECITPDNFAGKSPAEIAALKVFHGNREVPLGEWFDVSGSADDEIVVEGDCSKVKCRVLPACDTWTEIFGAGPMAS